MCRLTLCCCCCGLRVGAYLAASYTIALGLIGAIIAGVGGGLITTAKKIINDNPNIDPDQKHGANTAFSIGEIILYVTLAIYLLWVIFAIIMIVGTAKSKRGYLVPWIVMTIIVTIFCGIAVLLGLISIPITFASAASALSFVIQVALFILNIYSLVAVISFYKDDCVDREEAGGKHVV